jgi:glyoxylase-like metal-dependent hydrolase (beta-lactamase superfamily II)
MEIFKLVFSPIDVNTYILSDRSGNCAVIDCGCYDKHEFERLVKFIESKDLKPALLLNTHCHLDHIFGNRLFLAKYGIGAQCNILEEMNRESAVDHAAFFGLKMQRPPEPSKLINDNDVVSFGSEELVALLVPGHSPGSLAFYSKSGGCVFSGDALFSGSIGRSDLPGGDHDTLIKSIKSKLFTLPRSTVVYPGHGPETTIEREKTSNPFLT